MNFEFEPARADAAYMVKAGEEYTFEADLFLREGLIPSVENGTPFVATGKTITMRLVRVDPPYSDTLVADIANTTGSVDGVVTNRVRATVTLPTDLRSGDHLLEWWADDTAFPAGNKYMRVIAGPSLRALT